MRPLTFDEWFLEFEEELQVSAAEAGCNLKFELWEAFLMREYQVYVRQVELSLAGRGKVRGT